MVADAIFVTGELSCAAIDCQINAGVEIVVLVITNEVLVPFDIGSNFDVVSVRRAFNRDGELLKAIEELGQLPNFRHDVLGDRVGQFHVFCADGDEHGSILQFWRTIGRASATAAAGISSPFAEYPAHKATKPRTTFQRNAIPDRHAGAIAISILSVEVAAGRLGRFRLLMLFSFVFKGKLHSLVPGSPQLWNTNCHGESES